MTTRPPNAPSNPTSTTKWPFEVKAIVRRDAQPLPKVDLVYAGATSQFTGLVPLEAPGTYDVTVYAYDPANGNTGLDRTTFMVAQK